MSHVHEQSVLTPSQIPPMTPQEAKAQAKAAKAHAKALRPWFKKKRVIVPTALLALVAVIGVANAGGGDSATSNSVTTTDGARAQGNAGGKKDSPAKKEAAAHVGDQVRSGDMVFTITKVRTGVKSVGDEYLGEKAQGHFVLVDVKVKNVGDEAVTLWGFDHKLIDGKGREYSPNETAGIYVSEANALVEEINPGNAAKGTIVFDMPKGAKPVEAQLSGGMLKAPALFDLKG